MLKQPQETNEVYNTKKFKAHQKRMYYVAIEIIGQYLYAYMMLLSKKKSCKHNV